jgi:hypothetical protein
MIDAAPQKNISPRLAQVEYYGLLETIDRRHFYPTIEVAVEEFRREVQIRPQNKS